MYSWIRKAKTSFQVLRYATHLHKNGTIICGEARWLETYFVRNHIFIGIIGIAMQSHDRIQILRKSSFHLGDNTRTMLPDGVVELRSNLLEGDGHCMRDRIA